MNKLINPGRIIFATGMAALAILCFISKDFIVGRPPAWPEGLAVNPVLAYLSGWLLVVAAIAIVFKKKGGTGALLIAILIFLLSVLRVLPHFMNHWLAAYKTMALFGGALIIAASFDNRETNKWPAKYFVTAGCILLAAFFVSAGYAHFKFPDFVKEFIPSYIPFRSFWGYSCGVFLIAGGIGILIPQTRKWAALFSAIMVSGWFVLLHVPRFLANTSDVSDRMGLCESFTFAGIFFVLAGLFAQKK